MKFSIKLLILYQLVLNPVLADSITTPISSIPINPPGHNDSVNSVAISPDGRYILSGSDDGTMKLWEFSSGAEIRNFVGHTNSVLSVAISPDGSYALSGSDDETIKLWDISNGSEIRSFVGHTNSVHSVAFSPDGSYALSGSDDDTMKLWNLSSGDYIHSFIIGQTEWIGSVAFSPDGNYAVSGSMDNTIKLWNLSSGVEIRSFNGHTLAVVNSVTISPDGRYVLSGSDDETMKLWDISSGAEIRTFSGHTSNIMSVAISSDGDYAISGSYDKTMKLWNLSTGAEIRSFEGHTSDVMSVAISSDDRYAISGSEDSTIKIWDLSSGAEIRTIGYPHNISSIAISKDGNYALSITSDNIMIFWNLSSGAEICSFVEYTDINSVAISSNGNYALLNSDNSIKLLNRSNGSEISNFTGNINSITSVVAFSPDGNYKLSASDNIIKLWDISSGDEVRRFVGHTDSVLSVAFSPDTRYALSGSRDETMKLWDLFSGEEIHSFTGHKSYINSVAFSTYGNYALSGSDDNTMKLWDISSRTEIRSFEGHTNSVISVAFSPDGQYVYSGSMDRTLKKWNSGISEEPPKSIGQAIIIAAGGAQKSNSLYPYTNEYTQRFYRILKERGFKDEQITYMNPQAPDLNDDGDLEEELLDYPLVNPKQELITAFQQAAQNNGEQFILYIHGHARPDHFRIKPDYELSANLLKTLLDNITSTIQILILDSCYSGSFFDELKQKGLILISSADDKNQAWEINNSFANNLLLNLRRGFNLYEAFIDSKQMLNQETELLANQNPWLDDDGDGQFTENDGILAAKTKLGNKGIHGALPPTIQVHPPIELAENVTKATLWVKTIPSFDGIKKVRAVIINPEFKVSEYKGLETYFGREELELIYNPAQNRYEIAYQGFKTPGKWNILYQALSKEIVWSEIIKGTVEVTDMTKAATIKMQLKENRYKITEQLQLEVEINDQAQIDLYIALILPNGQFITFQDPSTPSLPNVAEIYKAKEKTIPIKLSNGATLGKYQICGVLVKLNTDPLKQENWIDINCQRFEIES